MTDDIYETEVKIHRTTDRAALVSEDDDEDAAVWVPLSECDWGGEDPQEGRTMALSLPQWLAEEKGMT